MNRLDPREDLHALMASRLYCVSLDKVTPELRAKSKHYTFSWRYSPIKLQALQLEFKFEKSNVRAERIRLKISHLTRRRQALVAACRLFNNMLLDCGLRLKSRAEWRAEREIEREDSGTPLHELAPPEVHVPRRVRLSLREAIMKCPFCTTTNILYAHDSACQLHPDKIAEADLAALVNSNSGFALHVREVRALERIATALEEIAEEAKTRPM